jgi:alpha-tubulin suppressor-like RCC1 family protein
MAVGRSDPLPHIPELAGDYDLVRELGRGGTAVVYLARDRELGRDVAVKLIRAAPVQDEDALARLVREARTVGKLQHPNIVMLLGTRRLEGGGLALILQYVPGRTLKERIREHGPLPFDEVAHVLRNLAEALAYAHRSRIVHRDLKPENVYLDESVGLVRLADFGIARAWDSDSGLTLPGAAIGTPSYMSPEQVDGRELDGRSDIYSLGLLGWEMLTGSQPWEGESLYAVISKQKAEALPPIREYRPDAPPWLVRALDRAMQKQPEDRWKSAEAFLEALGEAGDGARAGEGVSQAPAKVGPSRASVAGPARRRFRQTAAAAWALVALVVLVVVLGEPDGAVRELLGALGSRGPSDRGAALADASALTDAEAREPARSTLAGAEGPDAPVGPGGADAGSGEGGEDAAPGDAGLPDPLAGVQLEPLQEQGQAGVAGDMLEDPARVQGLDDQGPPAAELPGRLVSLPVSAGIRAGGSHSCMVASNGTVTCWGGNEGGQLGDGSGARRLFPSVPVQGGPFAELAPGVTHTCGVGPDGQVSCWGANDRGQLGREGGAQSTPAPVTAVPPLRALASGLGHSCGLAADGEAWCWGGNAQGQLGDGTTTARAAAAPVVGGGRFSRIVAGWDHTCAIDAQRRSFCWGQGSSGQLGHGGSGSASEPRQVSTTQGFQAMAAGNAHTCGLTTAARVYCWGGNAYGQLGTGGAPGSPVPVRIASWARFRAVSAGSVHSCALTTEGEALCWGRNLYGQLGDGTTDDRSAPTPVEGGHRFSQLQAMGSHTCGRTTAGEALCWGYNVEGQLGDGSRQNQSTPVRVGPIPNG